ncbi:hypothetical protein TNCV_2452921 [Trichonephila clavipes]|nr:hypothetical protein TNCV_2452921 [Trichonephila clavipes]
MIFVQKKSGSSSRDRILVPLKTHHVKGPMHVKSVVVHGPPVGEVWKLDEKNVAKMSSSSFDRGSKLRYPSPVERR